MPLTCTTCQPLSHVASVSATYLVCGALTRMVASSRNLIKQVVLPLAVVGHTTSCAPKMMETTTRTQW